MMCVEQRTQCVCVWGGGVTPRWGWLFFLSFFRASLPSSITAGGSHPLPTAVRCHHALRPLGSPISVLGAVPPQGPSGRPRAGQGVFPPHGAPRPPSVPTPERPDLLFHPLCRGRKPRLGEWWSGLESCILLPALAHSGRLSLPEPHIPPVTQGQASLAFGGPYKNPALNPHCPPPPGMVKGCIGPTEAFRVSASSPRPSPGGQVASPWAAAPHLPGLTKQGAPCGGYGSSPWSSGSFSL